jgi:hypothetical protein
MDPFRFSPIKTQRELIEAVKYIASQTENLSQKIIGIKLSISSLTVFSHYEDEFAELKNILLELGEPYDENNGPRIKFNKPIIINGNSIRYLRIRKPDSNRPQVGCNDFEVDSYKQFKELYLKDHPENLRLIKRPEYEMIEFFDSEFDVLAYVVSDVS